VTRVRTYGRLRKKKGSAYGDVVMSSGHVHATGIRRH